MKLAYDFTCEARVFFQIAPVKLAYNFTCEARVFFSNIQDQKSIYNNSFPDFTCEARVLGILDY